MHAIPGQEKRKAEIVGRERCSSFSLSMWFSAAFTRSVHNNQPPDSSSSSSFQPAQPWTWQILISMLLSFAPYLYVSCLLLPYIVGFQSKPTFVPLLFSIFGSPNYSKSCVLGYSIFGSPIYVNYVVLQIRSRASNKNPSSMIKSKERALLRVLYPILK